MYPKGINSEAVPATVSVRLCSFVPLDRFGLGRRATTKDREPEDLPGRDDNFILIGAGDPRRSEHDKDRDALASWVENTRNHQIFLP